MNKVPLAERIRPKKFEEYIGQEHLTGKEAPLKKLLDKGMVPSLIFWGPPGVGKTTLANLIADSCKRSFFSLSAINSGVKDIRDVIEKSTRQGLFGNGSPILFIDEIHRFSKSQQDSLLGAVEKGIITLIGATTENPSFEVISALLSRCQVYTLKALEKKDLKYLADHAIKTDVVLGKLKITVKEDQQLIVLSGGDARKLLNLLEMVCVHGEKDGRVSITDKLVMEIAQKHISAYDKLGEYHYDIISAFIKSIRGSDPDAAVYWLARMVEGGEDPKFIARRLIILAAEDIGLANPSALAIANSCFQAVEKIGWPESRIILSETAIYLANSAKSNSAYMAIEEALAEVGKSGDLPIPLHLRNAPTKLMKDLGYGKEYKYAHQFDQNFIDQQYLPDSIEKLTFYHPGENPKENQMKEFLKLRWNKYK
ncbi:MAG TPA: AAA family ATPase [Flavobacteriales bacterium]|nr:AAA family ATPase [Flavobacteriales bacterium]